MKYSDTEIAAQIAQDRLAWRLAIAISDVMDDLQIEKQPTVEILDKLHQVRKILVSIQQTYRPVPKDQQSICRSQL